MTALSSFYPKKNLVQMIHGKPGSTAMMICLRFTGSLREPHMCLSTKPAEMIQFVWPHDHYSKQTRLVKKQKLFDQIYRTEAKPDLFVRVQSLNGSLYKMDTWCKSQSCRFSGHFAVIYVLLCWTPL